jgi:hypothetical protein
MGMSGSALLGFIAGLVGAIVVGVLINRVRLR